MKLLFILLCIEFNITMSQEVMLLPYENAEHPLESSQKIQKYFKPGSFCALCGKRKNFLNQKNAQCFVCSKKELFRLVEELKSEEVDDLLDFINLAYGTDNALIETCAADRCRLLLLDNGHQNFTKIKGYSLPDKIKVVLNHFNEVWGMDERKRYTFSSSTAMTQLKLIAPHYFELKTL